MNSSNVFSHPGYGISLPVALLPVLLLLLALVAMDSFRLVRLRKVMGALLAGAVAGGVSYFLNSAILGLLGWPIITFAILVAPWVEETLKGLYMGWLLKTRRSGFLIDTAILGFATGSGFALIENLFYLGQLSDAPLFVWLIRGFGTAVMHGSTTAIFALGARALAGSREKFSWWVWLPGWLAAVLAHGLFNRMLSRPVLATLVVLIFLPLLMRVVYGVGEKRLRNWLGRGFDRDTELLGLINEGQVRETPLGRYLVSLQGSFRDDAVADMLCLLRLQAELSIRAKGLLLLREHGLTPAPDPDLQAKLAEVRHLEGNIGKTGLLALRPVCRWQGADRWQRHLLEEQPPTNS